MAWKQDPALVENAFGREFGNVQPLLPTGKRPERPHLQGGHASAALHVRRLDGPARRKIWEDAFAKLGHSPLVRKAYDRLYSLNEFDGDKLRAFFELWRRLGLTPNEVDYAFFIDRFTHLGGPPDDADSCRKAIRLHAGETKARYPATEQPGAASPAAAVTTRSRSIRAARDVGFYLDAYPQGALSEAEIEGLGRLHAAQRRPQLRPVRDEAGSSSKMPAGARQSLGRDLPLRRARRSHRGRTEGLPRHGADARRARRRTAAMASAYQLAAGVGATRVRAHQRSPSRACGP